MDFDEMRKYHEGKWISGVLAVWLSIAKGKRVELVWCKLDLSMPLRPSSKRGGASSFPWARTSLIEGSTGALPAAPSAAAPPEGALGGVGGWSCPLPMTRASWRGNICMWCSVCLLYVALRWLHAFNVCGFIAYFLISYYIFIFQESIVSYPVAVIVYFIARARTPAPVGGGDPSPHDPGAADGGRTQNKTTKARYESETNMSI